MPPFFFEYFCLFVLFWLFLFVSKNYLCYILFDEELQAFLLQFVLFKSKAFSKMDFGFKVVKL